MAICIKIDFVLFASYDSSGMKLLIFQSCVHTMLTYMPCQKAISRQKTTIRCQLYIWVSFLKWSEMTVINSNGGYNQKKLT